MDETPVVNVEPTTQQPSEGENQETQKPEVSATPVPGSKTDSELLLKSLQEEREARRLEQEKNRQLEEELDKFKSSALPEGEFSDEGREIIGKYVEPLQLAVQSLQDQLAMKDVLAAYPQLKDLSSEFETYRKDYPKHKLENVAKLFLTEKGLLETSQRKGLESPTSGPKTPTTGKMTAEEVKQLRETNYPKYKEMVKKGLIEL